MVIKWCFFSLNKVFLNKRRRGTQVLLPFLLWHIIYVNSIDFYLAQKKKKKIFIYYLFIKHDHSKRFQIILYFHYLLLTSHSNLISALDGVHLNLTPRAQLVYFFHTSPVRYDMSHNIQNSSLVFFFKLLTILLNNYN